MPKLYVKPGPKHALTEAQARRLRPLRLPRLRATREPVTLRVPRLVLDEIRRLAGRRGIPYQSLMNDFLARQVQAELRLEHPPA